MEKMPDGATADLRRHEANEARADARWDAFGNDAIESVVDDVVCGKGVRWGQRTITAYDFIRDGLGAPDGHEGVECFLDANDAVALLRRDEDVINRLNAKLSERVREWCRSSPKGQDIVSERVNALDEDARSGI
jgi:hypothetical protein